jgi:hypothetical protein
MLLLFFATRTREILLAMISMCHERRTCQHTLTLHFHAFSEGLSSLCLCVIFACMRTFTLTYMATKPPLLFMYVLLIPPLSAAHTHTNKHRQHPHRKSTHTEEHKNTSSNRSFLSSAHTHTNSKRPFLLHTYTHTHTHTHLCIKNELGPLPFSGPWCPWALPF